MRKRTLILLATIIICCGIVAIFLNKKEKQYVSPISTPEKIIVYKEGTVTNISNTDDKFKKLVDSANLRMKSIKGQTLNAFMKENLKKKSILLEFDYPNENKLIYWCPYSKSEESITYSKLYFCLEKNNSAVNCMDFDGQGYGPLGVLSPADEMIEVLEECF